MFSSVAGIARTARAHFAIGHATLIVCLSFGCRNETTQRSNQARTPPPAKVVVPAVYRPAAGDLKATDLLCMRPDSLSASQGVLEFGETASDQSTGDVAGLVFRLSVTDSGVTGEAMEATGESGSTQPFTELVLDLRKQTILFAYGNGDNRSQFTGRISCDRIWGRWEPYPKQVRERMTFKRMK